MPVTCGRTSATRKGLVRPGNSRVSTTGCGCSVTTVTCGGGICPGGCCAGPPGSPQAATNKADARIRARRPRGTRCGARNETPPKMASVRWRRTQGPGKASRVPDHPWAGNDRGNLCAPDPAQNGKRERCGQRRQPDPAQFRAEHAGRGVDETIEADRRDLDHADRKEETLVGPGHSSAMPLPPVVSMSSNPCEAVAAATNRKATR